MDTRKSVMRIEADGSGSESCPVTGSDISGVETLSFATRVNHLVIKKRQ
jgi:hypothetical protein